MTYGSGDADTFTYEAKTGRMTEYEATINGSTMYGTLGWSKNWTLFQLQIADPFSSANAQTCYYTYDDLVRLERGDCGAGIWGQSFSYVDNATNNIGAFGNISKSVLNGHTGTSSQCGILGYDEPAHLDWRNCGDLRQ